MEAIVQGLRAAVQILDVTRNEETRERTPPAVHDVYFASHPGHDTLIETPPSRPATPKDSKPIIYKRHGYQLQTFQQPTDPAPARFQAQA